MHRRNFLFLGIGLMIIIGIFFIKNPEVFQGNFFNSKFSPSGTFCKKYPQICNKSQPSNKRAEFKSTNFKALILSQNIRIRNAIELNPLITRGNYQTILRQKITDLENNNTNTWSLYRRQNRWTEAELRELYLQKVALSLWVEAHHFVPWSILDYDDENLNLLLSDLYVPRGYYASRQSAIFNGNPMLAFQYTQELQARYPSKPIRIQKDVLDLLIMRMREDGWRHARGDENAQEICSFPIFDFQCLLNLQNGSSILTAQFIYAILQSYNIPTMEESAYLPGGHTGIKFPSLSLSMEGNSVYNAFKAGHIVQPNSLPVYITYDGLADYERWNLLPRCEAHSQEARNMALNYLNLYDDPNWNRDIIATYCFSPPGYLGSGNYLTEKIIDDTLFVDCQNENPEDSNYQSPPLSNEELRDWLERISRVATCR